MSSDFPRNLIDFLSSPEMDEFLDITITTSEGQKHEVSKVIVAVHSKVLYKIFYHEPDKANVNLPTVSGDILQMIWSWMKSRELILSWENVFEILKTADFLEVPDVRVLCQEWLNSRMSIKNVCDIWTFARDMSLQDLEKSSMSFIGSKFTEIYKEKEFMDLPAVGLSILLSSDLITCGEEEVWDGLKVWLGHNNTRTEAEIRLVVGSLRVGLLENNTFYDKVQPVLEGFRESLAGKNNTEAEKQKFLWQIPSGLDNLKPRFPESLLFTFGWWSEEEPSNIISVFNYATAKWTDLSLSLPSDYKWYFMNTVVVDTDIFMTGCHWVDLDSARDSRVFMKFNPNTLEISRLSKMKESRDDVSLVANKECIYAIGGINKSTVEVYSISRNQWYMISPMKKIRNDAGAALLKGNLYAVGGYHAENHGVSSTVEMFSPITGEWTMVKSMKKARARAGVLALNSQLYVVGGWDGSQRLNCGEVYDPVTKEWSDLPNMRTGRSHHCVAVLNGKLVALGGKTGTIGPDNTTNSVEMLNLKTNTWEDLPDLPGNRESLFSCCVIPFNKLGNEVYKN